MGSLRVTMIDVDGVAHAFDDVADGISLMELGRQNGVAGILGECGGGCACATCHVYVAPSWWDAVGQPDDIEAGMLDMVADVAQPTSRLGCQVRMRAELDGLAVTVAPGSAY